MGADEETLKARSDRPNFAIAIRALVVAFAVCAAIILMGRGSAEPFSTPTLLRGTIITPNSVIEDGWVLVREGKISVVSENKPQAPDAIELHTGAIIFPGLIDLHNHLSYN